jgi:hypothetical protein
MLPTTLPPVPRDPSAPYTILFCGDLDWKNVGLVRQVLQECKDRYNHFVVVSGCSRGLDTIVIHLCDVVFKIPVKKFPANWDRFGKVAGIYRNKQMLSEGRPDLVIVFHNYLPYDTGVKHMFDIARLAGLPRVWYTEDGVELDERLY